MAHFTLTERPLYDQALIVRESDTGQFWHPDLPFPEGAENAADDVDISEAIDEQGYEYTRVLGEDYPEDDDDAANDAGAYWQWLRAWQPTPPDGDGWLLACIADTEDGPSAWFVRPKT